MKVRETDKEIIFEADKVEEEHLIKQIKKLIVTGGEVRVIKTKSGTIKTVHEPDRLR